MDDFTRHVADLSDAKRALGLHAISRSGAIVASCAGLDRPQRNFDRELLIVNLFRYPSALYASLLPA
jgi:hypothetical protein